MVEIFRIASANLFGFIAVILIIYIPCRYAWKICNRYWRHKTIQKMGYPPPHCDADGDFKTEPEKEEKEEEE